MEQALKQILTYSRRINTLIVLFAFGCYLLAFYFWNQEQNLGAFVIATMGYLLFRSLRKISFNLTWQQFRERGGEYARLLQWLDADHLALREEQLLELAEKRRRAE